MKKRILYYCMQGVISGGSDTCLYLLIKHLDKSKFEPILLYKYRSELVKDLQNLGVLCIPLVEETTQELISQENSVSNEIATPGLFKSLRKKLGKFGLLLGDVKNIIKKLPEIFKYASIILKYKIEIVHTNHHVTSDRPMILAAMLLMKKIIAHNRGYYTPEFIDTYFSNYIKKIVCMSDFSKSVYTSNGIKESKCATIYDGIDLNKFQPKESKKESIIVGCFGRLERWKGQHILVDAAEIIVKSYQQVKFYIVGEGATEKDLRTQIRSKNLEDSFVFTGGVTNVVDYMNKCSIVVHTSIEPEPFGMVIIEAMALAKPVIATNIGGPLEIIDNNIDGFLIPPGNPELLANQILRIINNPKLAENIALMARRKVELKFDAKIYTKQIELLYENI